MLVVLFLDIFGQLFNRCCSLSLSTSLTVCMTVCVRFQSTSTILCWIVVISGCFVPFTFFFWSLFLGQIFFGVCVRLLFIRPFIYKFKWFVWNKRALFPLVIACTILSLCHTLILIGSRKHTQIHLMLNWMREHIAFRFNRIEFGMHVTSQFQTDEQTSKIRLWCGNFKSINGEQNQIKPHIITNCIAKNFGDFF